MHKAVAFLVGFGLLSAVGCKPKGVLVGDWQGTAPSLSGTPGDVDTKFNPDGTYSLTIGNSQYAMEMDGTYTYDDSSKQLSLTQSKIKVGGKDASATGSAMGASENLPVTWKGSDEFTVNILTGVLDLKRK